MRTTTGRIVCEFLAVSIWLAASSSALAVTWRVERDGSGDFTTIQLAADAAAPGDSILIGPGHYTEYTTYSAGEKIEFNYYVLLDHNDITILGVHADLVTVGPAMASGYDSKAVGISTFTSTGYLTIENVRFAHCNSGIASNEEQLTVRQCLFDENGTGVKSSATGTVLIEDCEFSDNDVGVLQFDASATPLLIVRNCSFTDNSYGIDSQEENNVVENCTFMDNRVGVQFSSRAIGTIQNCQFGDNYVGIGLTSQSMGDISNCQVWGGSENLVALNGSHAIGSGNTFSGSAYSTITLSGQATTSIRGSHILQLANATRVRVTSGSGSGHIIDLRNNYWGTTSVQAIAASILDSQDDPRVTGTVLFEPFSELPVSTRTISFGELKSRLLRRN